MIFVFKTSVSNTAAVEGLKPILDKKLVNAKWNFDLEDCDKILRIDCKIAIGRLAIKLLEQSGFKCEELSD